jgi:succinoglycan biosynthesis protein ExoA
MLRSQGPVPWESKAAVGGVGGVGGAGGVGEVRRSSAGAKADGAGVVGGVWRVQPGADTAVARAIAAVVSHPLGSGGAEYRSVSSEGPERRSVETVPFGTFPKSVWEAVGGFDESLAVNEDFDFNYRARKAGYDVVLDRRISATYFARSTINALSRQYRRYGFWKCQMLRKDPRAFHPRQLPPVLVAPWLLLSAVAVVVTDHPLVEVVAALYPLLTLVGGVHVGMTRSVNAFAAAWAILTVHTSWSAGFWSGLLSRGPSRPPGQSRT